VDEKQQIRAVTRSVEDQILSLRGQRVILDSVLAGLYGVPVKVLNQSVRRNSDRFPTDFMFQLDEEETALLRSQIVTLDAGRGRHTKFRPLAFTEQGVAMLSGVLRSDRAVMVNIEIMRTFVRLRRMLSENADLARRLEEMERTYDAKFKVVFDAIRGLMTPASRPGKPIGFV